MALANGCDWASEMRRYLMRCFCKSVTVEQVVHFTSVGFNSLKQFHNLLYPLLGAIIIVLTNAMQPMQYFTLLRMSYRTLTEYYCVLRVAVKNFMQIGLL
ncbi:hypothetical protein DBV15_07410 [Temnothorax longispinosus]|uniref:Uncharacterized protein n=1 Tax=Temnothorax longispinosus TaxID=300112 RepID=A0A4V3S759_9HYME|nr:hypothetical protein DBV15_07410 [Temnothorax longispinosus]